jgi:hypothetical protein
MEGKCYYTLEIGQITLVQSLCKPFTVKELYTRFLAVNTNHKIPENPHHRMETHSSGHPNDSSHDRDALRYIGWTPYSLVARV